MTLIQARALGVCRVCEKPIGRDQGKPTGWAYQFAEMMYPEKLTLNFGEEFAHTDCLKTESAK